MHNTDYPFKVWGGRGWGGEQGWGEGHSEPDDTFGRKLSCGHHGKQAEKVVKQGHQRIAKDFNCAPNRETASFANPQKNWQAHSENPALWDCKGLQNKSRTLVFFLSWILGEGLA